MCTAVRHLPLISTAMCCTAWHWGSLTANRNGCSSLCRPAVRPPLSFRLPLTVACWLQGSLAASLPHLLHSFPPPLLPQPLLLPDFYYELGVQIVEGCITTRQFTGGLIELSRVHEYVQVHMAALCCAVLCVAGPAAAALFESRCQLSRMLAAATRFACRPCE